MNARAFLIEMTVISIIAFVLHLIWESAQCPLFFIHRGLPNTQTAMVIATLGDVILTWIAFFIVAAFSRNLKWYLSKWNTMQKLSLTVVAMFLGLAIEWNALKSGRWEYTDVNPLIPGTAISILPIFQLILLFPLTLVLARIVIKLNDRSSK